MFCQFCKDCCGRCYPKKNDEDNIMRNRSMTKDHDNLLLHHHLSDGLPCLEYDSLEYDDCYNKPLKDLVFSWTPSFRTQHAFITWLLMFAIGVCTALVAVGIDVVVDFLMDEKFDVVQDSVEDNESNGKLAISLLLMLAFNCGFVLIATLLTCFEPYAAGSGIPEVKCYLNGVKMPNVTRMKTLAVKAIGVLFSVAGGIFVGREGPMIHSGAVIAAGLPQFLLPQECYQKNYCLSCKKRGYRYFRSDKQKRDFVSGGAAAGVAAAFGAPIGGVLFSLEEGSSFWNQALTWKSLACAMTSTAVLNFFLSGINHGDWKSFDIPGLLNFGEFKCPVNATSGVQEDPNCTLWSVPDLLIFIIMGMIGGLLGATFNQLNYHLTRWRILNVFPKGKPVRALEAVLVAGVTTMFTFTASMTLGQCKTFDEGTVSDNTRSFFCDKGEFNDMATLFFNGQEASIKALYHYPDEFSISTLFIFFFIFFFLSCWTYGILVPSGLFVPSILCGAAYGRICGHLLYKLGAKELYAGSFALIGSAAFVGGVVRMTISLTVIMIETTNQITYGLPIMITLLSAKFVGDLFNIGLYDIHNEMKGIPFLEWDAPEGMEQLEAKDVMATALQCVLPHSTVEQVVRILKQTTHNAFPVVTPDSSTVDKEESEIAQRLQPGIASQNLQFRRSSIISSKRVTSERITGPALRLTSLTEDRDTVATLGDLTVSSINDRYNVIRSSPEIPMQKVRFHGVILRSQLIELLKNHVSYDPEVGPTSQKELDHWQMVDDYPRYPSIDSIDIRDLPTTNLMDLTPYMNDSPYTVPPHLVAPKVFNLFRTMGLRRLPVINSIGEIVGIITRNDLTHQAMLNRLHEKMANISTSPH